MSLFQKSLFESPKPASIIKPRDYQIEAKQSVLDYWAEGGGDPLVEMATGTGKSVVIADLVKELSESWPDLNFLMLTHVKELVEQNAKALVRRWQQAPIGINSAGLGRRDYRDKILFANVQSVFKRPELLGPRDIVLVDECHLVPSSGEGMYRSLLEALREIVPDLRVCGFTATPYRLDSGRLDGGDGSMFSDVVYSYDLGRAVDDGWLAPLVGKAMKTEIDVSGVARRGGEFVPGALEAAANVDRIVEGACDEIMAMGESRKSWLAFCSGVQHAYHVRDVLKKRGINAEAVTGEMPTAQRDSIIRAYREGCIRCLTNAMVLTTGFDVPHVDLIASMRPTLSTSLYVQFLGRGTRPVWGDFDPNIASKDDRVNYISQSSKADCLVLDFAGNCRRHGPVDAVVISGKRASDKERIEKTEPDTVRAKICPQCTTYNGLAAQTCFSCGYAWPIEPKHEAKSDAAPVMTREVVAKWIDVENITVARHSGSSGKDSIVVDYDCGPRSYREWVCVEHKGFPKFKSEQWWKMLGGTIPAPSSVKEALDRAGELNMPEAITVMRDGKYWRISGYKVARNNRLYSADDKYRMKPLPDEPKELRKIKAPSIVPFRTYNGGNMDLSTLDDEIPF